MLGRHMESTHLSNWLHFAPGSSIPGKSKGVVEPSLSPSTGATCWALAPSRNWVTMFICVARHLWSSGTRKRSCRTLSRFVVCDSFFFFSCLFPKWNTIPQTKSDKVYGSTDWNGEAWNKACVLVKHTQGAHKLHTSLWEKKKSSAALKKLEGPVCQIWLELWFLYL